MPRSAEAKLSREEGEALIEMYGLQHPSSSRIKSESVAYGVDQGGEPTMERPDEVNLSCKDGEALIERLQGDALTIQVRTISRFTSPGPSPCSCCRSMVPSSRKGVEP
jgi:hypothetical protein